jgi:hypothetical protein
MTICCQFTIILEMPYHHVEDGINSILIQHHYDKLMISRLKYFLDLALFVNVSHYESAYNMITSS